MKIDTRNYQPVLTGAKLEFFYSILTLWESAVSNKVVKQFTSAEIKRFLGKVDSHGNRILYFNTDINKRCPNCKYELYLKDTKRNLGLSLLYHLRNAFAHNNIELAGNGNIIKIQHNYKNTLTIKTTISFKILKELVETLRGLHNLTPQQKKKKYPKIKKTK